MASDDLDLVDLLEDIRERNLDTSFAVLLPGLAALHRALWAVVMPDAPPSPELQIWLQRLEEVATWSDRFHDQAYHDAADEWLASHRGSQLHDPRVAITHEVVALVLLGIRRDDDDFVEYGLENAIPILQRHAGYDEATALRWVDDQLHQRGL